MKNILLFLLISVSLYAEAKLYLGTNIGSYNETIDSTPEAYSSSNIASFKIGYADRKTYGIELSLDYTPNDSNIFSNNDEDRYGLNVNLSKAFDYDIYALPYLKVGIGAGLMNVDRNTDDRLYYGSFNVGGGLLLPVSENFDFELGYEYRYNSYEAINLISEKLLYTSNINIAYIGFNVRY